MCQNGNGHANAAQQERRLRERVDALRNAGDEAALAEAWNALGVLYRDAGQFEESLRAFREAGKAVLQEAGAESLEYALLLNNMASVFRLTGNRGQAIELFEQAAAVCQWQGTAGRGVLISILCNLSLVCQESQQLEEAVQHLEKALELLPWSGCGPEKTAVICHNLTILYHRLGCPEETERCLELSLKAFDEWEPASGDLHYAEALRSLAGLLYSTGAYRRAIDVYQKAAGHILRWYGETVEYAGVCQSMSWACEALEEWELARQALTKAERVFLRELGPKHERTQTVRDMLRRLRTAAS